MYTLLLSITTSTGIRIGNLELQVEGSKVTFSLTNDLDAVTLTGDLGTYLPPIVGDPIVPGDCGEGSICLSWQGLADLTLNQINDKCTQVSWRSELLSAVEDCIDIGDGHWYGGPEELVQHFPMRRENRRDRVPYLPGDMIQDKDKYFGGVAEPYWLNSKGAAIWIPEEQPLFYSWNSQNNSKLCISSIKSLPYPVIDGSAVEFNYWLCSADDAKQMQVYAAGNLWKKPTSIPDERMMTHPIWSTWAQYKEAINESVVLQFADDIIAHGFDNSQLEIDDNWETCYGDAMFDKNKFPFPARLVNNLKEKGFRVTLWIHPFINMECQSFMAAANPPNMYLVRDSKAKYIPEGMFGSWEGLAYLPGLMWWWQGFTAGYIDFTNPEAVDWWRSRLETLRSELGIHSFKFDAGEYNWLPSSFAFNEREDPRTWPGIFSTRYVESVSEFGSLVEVRTGRHSQHLPIFVRMLDKFSVWGYENGLKSMVTTLLQFGIVGYPFVLPDMIGGNGYGNLPSRELYIRWLQVNVFMPAVQISFVPWMYDADVVAHAAQMVDLHAEHAPRIISLAIEATATGLPINRPIWWLDPQDEVALGVDSEFLLGDDILVAPVMDEGAVTRDIYLPKGTWKDMNDEDKIITGPTWIYDYKADLYTLPYFLRQ